MPVSVGDDHLRAQSVDERPTGSILGQVEAYGGPSDWFAGLLGDLHRDGARTARSRQVYGALALNYADLEDGDLGKCRRHP